MIDTTPQITEYHRAIGLPAHEIRPVHTGVPPTKSKPKVLLIGHARHGKDTVAELMRDNHGYTFASSSFFAAGEVVRPALAACGVTYPSLEACYEDRVNFRAFWYEAIKAFNGGGKSRLAEAILKDHDIYVGMRSHHEYIASLPLFDYVGWVDATERGVPPEPRDSFDIDFDPETMIWIDNSGTLADLVIEVDRFVRKIEGLRPL